MKRLRLGRDAAHVENATVVREFGTSQKWRRLGLICVGLVALAAAWPAWVWYLKPWLDERRVEAVLVALSTKGDDWRKRVDEVKAMPREQMLLTAFAYARKSYAAGLTDEASIVGARAALDLAIRDGSVEAGIALGKAFRDGLFGTKDSLAALREFERVGSDIEPGAKVGDSDALYWHAIMMSEGLGVNMDRDAALVAMKRAATGLSGARLKKVVKDAQHGFGLFAGRPDAELAGRLASRLLNEGDLSAYEIGTSSCRTLKELPAVGRTSETRATFNRAYEGLRACLNPWITRAAKAGNKEAMADYADVLLEEGSLGDAKKWYEAAGSERNLTQAYYYGLVQALTTSEVEGLLRSAKVMWAAQQEDRKSEHPMLNDMTAYALDKVKNTLARTGAGVSRSLVVALLVQGELAGTSRETIAAIRMEDLLIDDEISRPASLTSLAEAPSTRQTASLIAEAIRTNKPLAELAAGTASSGHTPSPAAPSGNKNRGSDSGAIASNQPDPEQQSRSGYLPNSRRAATGGLSTFAVDNANGERDAVVRLYVGGKKPAVRSFYVKQGGKFTARSLSPGTYVLRYRFIGSDDTFEADRRFVLEEAETERGKRFSNFTVTLFSDRDGNLSTKKVAAEEF